MRVECIIYIQKYAHYGISPLVGLWSGARARKILTAPIFFFIEQFIF